MKSIYNLRKLAMDFRSDVYKRDEADYMDKIADEIEAEVEDVLQEFANDVLNADKQLISEQGTEAYVLSAANEYAERLREVLRDE